MAKAKSPEKAPRILPSRGGSSIRDKVTGELRPNIEPETPAVKPAEEGK